MKLTKFIQQYLETELPLVSLPTEREEELCQLISMKQFQVKTRTALINRLHALYMLTGETGLKGKDLALILDCSGDTVRYGRIQRGRRRALRSVVAQSAWPVSRSSGGGRLKEKFMALSGRISDCFVM